MPVYGTYLDMLQKEASIRDTNALAGERQMQMMINGKLMEARDRALQNDEAYRQQKAKLFADGNPFESNPATTSVGGSQGDNPTGLYGQSYKALTAQKNFAQKMIMLNEANGKDSKEWAGMLEKSNKELADLAKDVTADQVRKGKETAQILNGVNSVPALEAAIEHIADQFGEKEAEKLWNRLPHGPDGGVLWNDRAKQILKSGVDQYTTMHERGQLNHWAVTEKQAEAEAARHAREHTDKLNKEDKEYRLHREQVSQGWGRLDEMRKRTKALQDITGGKTERDVTKNDQAEMDKQQKTWQIAEYKKVDEVAKGIEAQLVDPAQGFKAVTPDNARLLVEQMKLVARNFKAGQGGKYQEDQINRMNGWIEKVGKWVEEVPGGNKILEKDVMLHAARDLQTVAADRNVNLLKNELSISQHTNPKGGNATWLRFGGGSAEAGADWAIQSGNAEKITIDGHDYLTFGKTKKEREKKENMFPMPVEPKRKGPLFIPDEGE